MIARIPYERCPLCDAQGFVEVRVASCTAHPLYDAELPPTMRWLKCDGCAHVFVDGYFSDPAQALLFRNVHLWQVPGPETVRWRAVSAKIVEHVSTTRGAWSGRWLDVGFGNGALLTTAAEFGYDVIGLDRRDDTVTRMRELGFDTRCMDIAAFEVPEGLDVLSMADVLEHMPFPKQGLEHARRLLRPGGALFVSMPNIESFAWTELDREQKNPYWGEIEHFHNFGRSQLHRLLSASGFEPRRYAISERYLASMEVIAVRV
jgi:SAM-dependent methyltransferase